VNKFKTLIDNSELIEYLDSSKVNLKSPTNIQKLAIPKLNTDGNYIIHGKTGSGKSLAFLLPIFSKLKELENNNFSANTARPLCVVMAPTRELTLQLFELAKEMSHFCKLRVRKLVGGDKGNKLDILFSSKMDILVCTPDRLLKAVKNKELFLSDLQILALDEADQLLENSFSESMTNLFELIDLFKTKIYLISATSADNYAQALNTYFENIKFETIGKGFENKIGHNIRTFNINTNEDDKFHLLKSFIKKTNKSNGIVFTGNRHRAIKAYELLSEQPDSPTYLIHKEMSIKERKESLEAFRKTGGIIIATDILARGVDITHLHWVLNFDLPSASEYYLHRTGRVGRAGKKGDVYNFITQHDLLRKKKINIALTSQGRHDLKLPLVVAKQKKKK